MATAPIQPLDSNNLEKKPEQVPLASPLDIHAMPARYESEEEQVSEPDTTNRDELFFSAPDHDSDVSNGDSSENASQSTEGTQKDIHDDERADLKFKAPSSHRQNADGGSRRPSLYARRRSSLTQLSLTQQPQQKAFDSDTANTSHRPSISSSIVFRSEGRQSILSLISDGGSDDGSDEPFLVATPVAYHCPSTRPNLVSISTIPNSPVKKRTSKKQKKERRASFSSLEPTDTNNTGLSMASRLARLRMAKHDQRHSTYLLSEASHDNIAPPDSSKQSAPSFIGPNWGCDTSPRNSAIDLKPNKNDEQSFPRGNGPYTKGKYQPSSFKRSPEETGADARHLLAEREPQSIKEKQYDTRPACLISGYGRPGTETSLSPNNMEQPASPCTSLHPGTPLPNQDKQPIIQRKPVPDGPHTVNPGSGKPIAIECTDHLEAPYKFPPSIHSTRAGSTSSMTSNSSKSNTLPDFDPASLSARNQRLYHRPQPSINSTLSTSTSTSAWERRPSNCSTESEQAPRPPYQAAAHFGSQSATNLSLFSAPNKTTSRESDCEDQGWKRNHINRKNRMSISDMNQQHLRLKGKKWLQGTGGSVSNVGYKALDGIGFKLKKKPT